jgi:transposase
MKEITTVGVDLAKDVIMVCAADRSGRPALVRKFSRHGFGEWAATLAPCTFGMEAQLGPSLGRWLAERGHRVRLMPPNSSRHSARVKVPRTIATTPKRLWRR